jgi:peptide/nickel transport system permease protein
MMSATMPLFMTDLGRACLRAARRVPRATIGIAILATVAAAALLAPLIAPYGQTQMAIPDALQAPTLRHIFGTDTFGRDVFSLCLFGGRPALTIAGATVGVAVVLGVPTGIVAGYVGGWIDGVLMGLTELALALPPIVLAVVIIAFLGPGLENVVLALALVNAPLLARVARGSTLTIRTRVFVDAARAVGDSDRAIMLRQIAPNIATPVLVQASLSFAYAMLAEASLSFLGLGTPPAEPSWGRMLTDAIPIVAVAPWMGLFPGLFIVMAVVSLNLIGDGLRDLLDPALRTSAGVR